MIYTYVGPFRRCLVYIGDGINVGKTRINHPQITINRWYKPFPNGWFIFVLTTLFLLNPSRPFLTRAISRAQR